MLFEQKDFWSALMSLVSAKVCRAVGGLSLPVTRHAHMLQAGGGSALFLPAYLGYFITESVKGDRTEFSESENIRDPGELRAESNELRATCFVGDSNDSTR